jgi:hypothetical protein
MHVTNKNISKESELKFKFLLHLQPQAHQELNSKGTAVLRNRERVAKRVKISET